MTLTTKNVSDIFLPNYSHSAPFTESQDNIPSQDSEFCPDAEKYLRDILLGQLVDEVRLIVDGDRILSLLK